MRDMKRKNRWIGPLVSICLVTCMAFGGAMVSYAASSRKTISKVTINLDLELEAGESLPDLEAGKDSGFNVRAGNERYTATEAQWVRLHIEGCEDWQHLYVKSVAGSGGSGFLRLCRDL